MDQAEFQRLQRGEAAPPAARTNPYLDQVAMAQGAPGQTPHLLQLLEEEFRKAIFRALQAKQHGRDPSAEEVDAAFHSAPASSFISFATGYLKEHRAVENFMLDANFGFRLQNNRIVSLSPDEGRHGQMQDAGSIGVTEGRSQKDLEGVYAGPGAIQI